MVCNLFDLIYITSLSMCLRYDIVVGLPCSVNDGETF